MPTQNNPFAPAPPTEVSQAAHRFPDVLNQDPDLRHQQQQQQPLQQQQQQYTGAAQQQQYGGMMPQQTGYGGQAMGPGQGQQQPYQPQQQYLSPQQTGYYQGGPPNGEFGAQYQQPQQIGYGGGGGNMMYGGGGGQANPQQPYYSDLDPYSNLGASSFAAQNNQNGASSGPGQQGGGSLLAVQQTTSHPRDYVQENKSQLMVWDEYAWKQLFSRLDALREAWEARVNGLKAASNSGADPTSVNSLRRDADDKVDSIHASKMQLDEVKAGWRHSTDVASKARVREALNAGLSSLPPYPSPVHPSQLGGSFTQKVQKDSIMAQYTGFGGGGGGQQQFQQQQQQMTGYGGMQPQMTGYGGGGGGGGMMGMQPQMTGYGGGGGGMQPQMTGYGGSGGMMLQGYGGGMPQQGYGGGGPYY
ncbi:hypothetical protein JCM8202_004556 [Rhodotorula sphaerocarpa]